MVAVFDVGSNSLILLVTNGQIDLHDEVRITRLGEGLDLTGKLTAEAIQRCMNAVDELLPLTTGAKILAVGTAALREAANADQLMAEFAKRGLDLRVLSEDEEAGLSYASVATDPAFGPQATILDLGGRSLELADQERRISLPIGASSVIERCLKTDPPLSSELLQACIEIDTALEPLAQFLPVARLGLIGGTAVTLMAIKMGEFDADRIHGKTIALEDISEALTTLAPMTADQRLSLPGLDPGRERTIVGGTLILERAMVKLGVETAQISVKGLRHAIAKERGR